MLAMVQSEKREKNAWQEVPRVTKMVVMFQQSLSLKDRATQPPQTLLKNRFRAQYIVFMDGQRLMIIKIFIEFDNFAISQCNAELFILRRTIWYKNGHENPPPLKILREIYY